MPFSNCKFPSAEVKVYIPAVSDVRRVLNAGGAAFSNLTDQGFASMKDLFDSPDFDSNVQVELTIVMNNESSADNYLKIAAVAVTGITTIA